MIKFLLPFVKWKVLGTNQLEVDCPATSFGTKVRYECDGQYYDNPPDLGISFETYIEEKEWNQSTNSCNLLGRKVDWDGLRVENLADDPGPCITYWYKAQFSGTTIKGHFNKRSVYEAKNGAVDSDYDASTDTYTMHLIVS